MSEDKITGTGTFFKSSNLELNNFFCGYGTAEIKENSIIISDYPFKPSIIFSPNQYQIEADKIESICLESNPPQIEYKNEVIFISAEQRNELELFIKRNKIKTTETNWTWDWILEPFLDTELTNENEELLYDRLNKIGIDKQTCDQIRSEVEEQMLKYNFDTMLWEWVSLGLSDVLKAMRVKYDKNQFETFYSNAMKIEMKRVT